MKNKLPAGFIPHVAIVLGSGGWGEITALLDTVVESIPYRDIPGFGVTTVPGHEGAILFGHIYRVPVMFMKGRTHYYETGPVPDQITAMRRITFPVHVAQSLGTKLYIATNAAGGLNTRYKTGDLMVIRSHISLFVPSPLLGSVIKGMPRFVPQNTQYDPDIRNIVLESARTAQESKHVHEGVYCGVTGPAFESNAECQMLRKLGADAVGMSTVPEIIVATALGMKTAGLSLITNVIAKDGTNATSHEEVMDALNDKKTRKRISSCMRYFFKNLKI